MCLLTTQKVPHVATKNIPVYKIMKNGWTNTQAISEMGYFTYNLGELYTTNIKQSDDYCVYDNEESVRMNALFPGFHDYPEDYPELKSFAEGFHSSKSKKRMERNLEEAGSYCNIYKCTIPKGAEYYESPTGLVVSNQIIINEKITN